MTTTSDADLSTPVCSPAIQAVSVTMDSRGRVRVSKGQRQLLLAEFERSRVSAAQFAKRIGLKYSTLAGWLQRYRRTKPKGRARAVRLLEAVVEQNAGDNRPLVLELAGGAKVEITDAKQAVLAAALLRALATPC
jgi:transposase-like protein